MSQTHVRARKGGYSTVAIGDDYSDEEREFMMALDRWKRKTGNKFPTCRDVLNVLRSLGWQKPAARPEGGAPAGPAGRERCGPTAGPGRAATESSP